MCGRIVRADRPIPAFRHDGTLFHDDRTHRHLAGGFRGPSKLERPCHETRVDARLFW